jgi:ribosome-binding protein aMBF1 (putative translation factor)
MKTWEELKKELKKKGGRIKTDVEEMENLAEVVTAIYKKREKIGLSQQDLAKLCDIPQSTIARIETFKTTPNIDTLIKITHKLGLKVAVL